MLRSMTHRLQCAVNNVVADTHALIWTLEDDARLGATAGERRCIILGPAIMVMGGSFPDAVMWRRHRSMITYRRVLFRSNA
jgi:hypothetical protein